MGERGIRKLTTFLFPQDKVSAIQDGAGGLTDTSEAYTDLPDAIHSEMGTAPLPTSPTHDPGSDPLTSSPAKARMRMDTPQPHSPHISTAVQAQAFNPFQSNQALHNSMASFPTSGQPVIDTTLKEMLMSLQTSLMTDLSSLFSKISTEMHSMDNRISNMERGMTECSATVNDIIDAVDDIKDEQHWVRAKLADLEDRSRRNNVKLRGVPESIPLNDLPKYAKDLIHTILPDAAPRDIVIDRIHRIAKPSHLAASVPRDVLMRIHFFHIKEKMMSEARVKAPLPRPYEAIQIFPDLSKFTLQMRRKLNPITKGLSNHKIPYKWRYPATILIMKNGTTHVVNDLMKGLRLLHDWGIILEPPTDGIPPLPQRNSSHRRNNQKPKIHHTHTNT